MRYLKDRYVNPLTDFGFKKLFGSEPNKELLQDFLNQVLPENHQIKELQYAKNEHLGTRELDRNAIFDLYCISETGERFIVELQKAKQHYFKDRSIYYASFPIREQAQKGEWDYKLEAIYTVGILDFVFDDHKDDDTLMHIVELKDQECKVFYDKLKFIYIELPKFQKTEQELETQFDKWLYVFRFLSKLQDRPLKLQDRIFTKLFEAAEIAKYTNEEMNNYEGSLKYYRDYKNTIDTSRNDGIQEGIAKGKIEVALQMKKEGMSPEMIAKMTGINKEQIEEL